MKKQLAVSIIDPFNSPGYLGEALRRRKVKSIAVFQHEITKQLAEHMYNPLAFDIVFHASGWETDEIIRSLNSLDAGYVLYGNEFAVEKADIIAKSVCPEYANSIESSICRWNKFYMNRKLEDAGLRSIRQRLVGASLNDDDRAAIKSEFSFPVIVKPSQAGGTQGMARCDSLDDIESHLADIPREEIFLRSDSFVVQEFIEGEEYFIDTVSVKGRHHISSMFHNVKHYLGQSNIYRRTEIIDSAEMLWKQGTDYVLKVLDLLEYHNGFAHTEIFMTDKGPLLLEVNPRISGALGIIQKITRYVYGWSQPDLLVDSLEGSLSTGRDFSCSSYGILVYLNNWQKNHTLKQVDTELLSTLPSYRESVMLNRPGIVVQPPVSLYDTVAYLLLHHQDRAQVEKDYNLVIEWEKEGKLC